MSVAVVTGSSGLFGEETLRVLRGQGLGVVDIDDAMRKRFFAVRLLKQE